MKTLLLKKWLWSNLILLFSLLFSTLFFGQAGITTDKDDYLPGERVIINGTSWLPGEQVSFSIKEIPSDNAPLEYSAVADTEGNVLMDQFVTLQSHLGKAFFVTATGSTSEATALGHFTDANFTSNASGNWNNPATWGLSGSPVEGVNYPGAGDVVTITKNNAVTLTANANSKTEIPFNVIAYPNPSTNQFTLEIEGDSTEIVAINVFDIAGRLIKEMNNIKESSVTFGESLPRGVYIAVVQQGSNQKTIRIIKG